MVGRCDEMEFLLSRWGSCISKTGSCIIIVGEAGSGKTRLMDELRAKSYLTAGAASLLVRFQRQSIRPFSPIVEAVSTIKSSPFFGKGEEEINRILEEMDQQALFRIFYEQISSLSQSHPLLIEVDDVQWADSNSLGFLRYLMRRIVNDRILLVISVREEETGVQEHRGSSDVVSFLLEMFEENTVEIVKIHPLDINDSTEIISRGLGFKVDPPLGEAIYSHAEGNPLYTMEWVRHLSDNDLLEENDGVVRLKDRMVSVIPSSINDVVIGRLNDLNPEDLKLLTAAAVIGAHFPTGWIKYDLDDKTVDDPSFIRRIEGMKGTLSVSDGEISFIHDLIRRVIYDNISWTERISYHIKLAHWLETNVPTCHPGFVSDQYESGGDEASSGHFALQAGLRYSNEFAAREASFYFLRAVNNIREGEKEWLAAMEGYGDSLFELCDYENAIRVYEKMLHHIENEQDKAHILLQMADCWSPHRLGVGNDVNFKRLVAEVSHISSLRPVDEGEYWSDVNSIKVWMGDYSQVGELEERALQCFKKAERWDKIVWTLNDQCFSLVSQGKPSDAIKKLEEAVGIYRDHSRAKGEEATYIVYGEALLNLGDHQGAEGKFRRAIELALFVGESYDILIGHYYLAIINLLEGDMENAQAHSSISQKYADGWRCSPMVCLPHWVKLVALTFSDDVSQICFEREALKNKYFEYKTEHISPVDGFVRCAMAFVDIRLGADDNMAQFESSLSVFKGAQFEIFNEMIMRYMMGNLLASLNWEEDAKKQWERAIVICDTLGNCPMKARIRCQISSMNDQKNKVPSKFQKDHRFP